MFGRFRIRTDLALEARESFEEEDVKIRGVRIEEEEDKELELHTTTVVIETENGAKTMGKPVGTYITMEAPNMSVPDEGYHREISEKLAEHLRTLMGEGEKSVLIVGLGNRDVTPDALGPYVVQNVRITRHLIREYGAASLGEEQMNPISGIVPGVMAQTGIETVDIVRGICDEIDVEIVVAIDALAARSSKRLGCTIQLTDTGISPGSGVGNNRKTLSSDNLGRRVIAVGVPTVISVPSIIDDSLDEVADAFNETYGRRIMREFTEKQRYQIACNLLDEDMADMFVTPKNIDELVRRISFTISEAINAIAM